ncbi:MAG: bifunctional diaminohydroxyphosphoribosylaminopyrimidine deaminase/5-amino-6-(5-phosphoribosylamino)uracil reductase RibD [Planctomycetota bacterium]|nr:bifunctional diaminohydroxyphosphoribosylaminopyrimidine deaminase/5-amino-6-(5-phosphoribosylamino)uracil reductase RibD [Planctomycetota bacterium]
MLDQFDRKMMQRALDLAYGPVDPPYPNPRVGAVIVREEEVLSEGCHAAYDQPHAEYKALEALGFKAEGATIYVTLEPCCPFEGKRNPSCAELISRSGITRAVIGHAHPELGQNMGCDIMRKAGIQVDVGALAESCDWVVKGLFHYRKTRRPYVLAKWAMTADGLIAPPDRSRGAISSPEGFRFLHLMRHWVDAILIGIGTAKMDNPRLTCREAGFRHPLRVVVDPLLELSPDSNLAQTDREKRTLLIHSTETNTKNARALVAKGVKLAKANTDESGGIPISEILRILITNNSFMVLIEGGSNVHSRFFEAKAVDEYMIAIAPKILGGMGGLNPIGGGGTGSIDSAVQLEGVHYKKVGTDIILFGRPAF